MTPLPVVRPEEVIRALEHAGFFVERVKGSHPVVAVLGNPNADNKIAFRNFDNVVVGGLDTRFDTLIRFADWIEGDRIQIVPRGPAATLVVANPEAFPKPVPRSLST